MSDPEKNMVQMEAVHDPKRGGFVVTFSPVRSRWVKYGGKTCRVCKFDGEAIFPGAWYYRSEMHGSICETHAGFMFGVKRNG